MRTLEFSPENGTYRRVFVRGGWYLEYESQKGDIGAIGARCGVPDELIPLFVTIVRCFGGFEIVNPPNCSFEPITSFDYKQISNGQCYNSSVSVSNLPNPQQLSFPGIFKSTPYDETSHLTPNGKKRRKRR